MYVVKLTARARTEFKNISSRHLQVLSDVFDDLKDNPYLGKPLTRELTGRYSYRVGMFRVIYRINEKDQFILILTVGHRSTVYI